MSASGTMRILPAIAPSTSGRGGASASSRRDVTRSARGARQSSGSGVRVNTGTTRRRDDDDHRQRDPPPALDAAAVVAPVPAPRTRPGAAAEESSSAPHQRGDVAARVSTDSPTGGDVDVAAMRERLKEKQQMLRDKLAHRKALQTELSEHLRKTKTAARGAAMGAPHGSANAVVPVPPPPPERVVRNRALGHGNLKRDDDDDDDSIWHEARGAARPDMETGKFIPVITWWLKPALLISTKSGCMSGAS